MSCVRSVLVLVILPALLGFAEDRSRVSAELSKRTGVGLNPQPAPRGPRQAAIALPPGITLGGKLSADDAVAIALWNNAAFEAAVANLGVARAEVVDAGLLRNLSFQALLPVGPKPFEMVLQAPVEALWQRPRRVAAARLALDQVAEGLVAGGLDLARDVRLAHAELEAAEQRAVVATESAKLRLRIAELTERRLRAGDVSEMEANVTRLDARAAAEAAERFSRDVESTRERLRMLLGLRMDKTPLSASPGPHDTRVPPEWDQLIEMALASRPDLRAAEVAVEAALARARWERSRVLALLAPLLSVKGVGNYGIRSGPGFQTDVPVFNRNQGGISRADAEVERAARQYVAVRDLVELEVRKARIDLVQALTSLERIRGEILPASEEAVRLAERAYANGDMPYLFVLEVSRQVYDVRSRELDAVAGVRRATANLEHGLGRKL